MIPKKHILLSMALMTLGACDDVEGDDGHGHSHDHGAITTVELVFTPQSGGQEEVFAWSQPGGEGSNEIYIDDIVLDDEVDYDLSIQFINDLEDPAEDITEEVREEDDEHQLFFTGTVIGGPASESDAPVVTQAYTDSDSEGLPVGMENTMTTDQVGSGELTVTLQHMPPENDQAVKVAGLAEEVASKGTSALPGSADFEIVFNIDVE